MDRTRLTRMFIPALMCMAAATPCAATASAETADDRYILYINTYSQMAVDQQAQFGIPASITLAQGLLESAAGRSTLAREGNNHFGIKCKSNWTGERVYHDDDAKGECFRAYPSVEASYEDHAEFLDRQPRYDSLFCYAATDYRSWARGLKAAGYATAPDYALRLVRIIENNRLYLFDREGGERLYAAAAEGESGFAAQSSVGEPALAAGGVDRIMFDNFTPEMTRQAVEKVAGRCETESSGGITLETLADYAACGVDFISVGALTHQIRSLDMSLKAC